MPESPAAQVAAFVLLTAACAALIAGVASLTRERIEANRVHRFQQTLVALTGSATQAAALQWDGDVALLCPHRLVLRGSAPGYGGDIAWLAAADVRGEPVLTRLRITAHRETPGIADFLDTPEQGWLERLQGMSRAGLADADAVSGATITSRALSRSLAAALARPAVTSPQCPE